MAARLARAAPAVNGGTVSTETLMRRNDVPQIRLSRSKREADRAVRTWRSPRFAVLAMGNTI